MEYKRLKRITSHVGYARFLSEVTGSPEDDCVPIGYIPRVKSIPSPYHYSFTIGIYVWNGQNIFTRQTSHKVYEVFAVPAEQVIYSTEDEAFKVFKAGN